MNKQEILEKLNGLNLDKEKICADLFCGTGTIGIICAKKTGATVYGVEINEDAVKDAKFNAKLNGITNISFEFFVMFVIY